MVRCMGFVGIDKTEIIQFLSRILCCMGKRVLVLDCAESKALFTSLPSEIADCMVAEDTNYHITADYRGVSYREESTNREDISFLIKVKELENFDCVLIDFGFFCEHKLLEYCDCCVYVTDQQRHNTRRIYSNDNHINTEKYLIIKDVQVCKIKPKQIADMLPIGEIKESFVLQRDMTDEIYRIKCQYDGIVKFPKLSREFQRILVELTSILMPGIAKNEMIRACKAAKKGE